MTATVTNQISGLELYWQKVKRMGDHVMMARFRECLGKPSKGSFYRLMKNPGKMKTSHAIELAKFLTGAINEVIQPEDFLKSY